MRFLVYEQLRMEKGVPYSDRQLKRLEAKGAFPKRVALCAGGSLRGWPEVVIDRHIEGLVEKCVPTQRENVNDDLRPIDLCRVQRKQPASLQDRDLQSERRGQRNGTLRQRT